MVSAVISPPDHSKSCGHYLIPTVVFKKCAFELTPVLSKFHNKCLATSCFPTCWKTLSVVLAFKNSAEAYDPSDYQLLSIQPASGKLLAVLINSKLGKHFTSQGLISVKKYGFRISSAEMGYAKYFTKTVRIKRILVNRSWRGKSYLLKFTILFLGDVVLTDYLKGYIASVNYSIFRQLNLLRCCVSKVSQVGLFHTLK